MLSQAFEVKFVTYLCVASLTIMLWDLLDNLKNDYRLLFQQRLGFPTVVYFLSRASVLGFILVTTIFFTDTPSIPCTVLETTFTAFIIADLVFTPFLAYLRVCAVWHWNRFIVGFFGVSWLAVAASGFTLIISVKGIRVHSYCTDIFAAQGPLILAPYITTLFNHTVIFLAITYGVCKNTMGKDLSFRDSTRLMLGEGLPTFSKALLHDSQVSYILIMAIIATTLGWCYVWMEIQPSTAFRLALVPPCLVLENILICRVFRNTKLGIYSKVPVQSNDRTHASMISCNSRRETINARDSVTPIEIAVSQVVDYESEDPPLTRSNHSVVDSSALYFGMA